MDQIWTRINELAEANNGFVRTAQVEALGISRPMLRKYTDAGKLEQVRKGLYVLADGMPDEYALLQGQCRDAVFSYGICGIRLTKGLTIISGSIFSEKSNHSKTEGRGFGFALFRAYFAWQCVFPL